MFEFIQKYDVIILDFLNELGNPNVDFIWLFITKKFVWVPFFVVLLFFGLKKHTNNQARTILFFGILMFCFVTGITEIVKLIFFRIRPCNDPTLNGVFRELINPKSYSFYSGHAAASVSICTFFVSLLKTNFKVIYILIVWAILFMFSRLYLAAHYPSDILVGIIVGFTIAKLFVRIVKNKLDVLDLQNPTNSKSVTNS